MDKLQRFKFGDEADLLLLREVVATQAFNHKNGQGWKLVAENLSKIESFPPSLQARTVRDRTNLLLTQYKTERRANEGSSGIEEEVTEKNNLLDEILLLKEEKEKAEASQTKAKDEREAGELVRQQAMQGMARTTEDAEPSASAAEVPQAPCVTPQGKKRKGQESTEVLRFLEMERTRAKEKEEERKLREVENRLREKELELQAKKQEDETKLRREELEAQRQERLAFLQMMSTLLQKNTT